MAREKTKWKDRGFDDKYHYAGWLYFNDLTDDSKMYDDVYYDAYTGKVINILADDRGSLKEDLNDEAALFLARYDVEEKENV
ncbi:hypothetical protein [Escherichia coli]|uniref:hypothetical protein n=1 Tax=Escherichia coli TaxID=562 RepID=UPI000CFC4B14|nr:hypothetical protein [Escherichia coli]